jgi:uncharacterized repeat protein (TIGR03803 family)
MNTGKRWPLGLGVGVVLCLCLAVAPGWSADYQTGYAILHDFIGGTGDGYVPWGTPVLSGATLYGLTSGGGEGAGVLFRVNTDGTGYSLMHVFANDLGVASGTTPRGSLALSGTTLYGFTAYGGDQSVGGTVFKTDTSGGSYQVLLVLQGAAWLNGHVHPYGTPILSGGRLYGITQDDNSSLFGSLFSINTEGGEGQLLHEFAGKPSDGHCPAASPILSGTTLYGMTTYGGPNGISGGGAGYGTIYAIGTDGTGYRILHNFAGYPDDGNSPTGSLLLLGGTLYGLTSSGGADNGSGVLFSVNTDGTGYRVLFDFSNKGTSGPKGGLILLGNTLYGMTSGGCPGGGSGAIFQINPDGAGFQILHCFGVAPGDGGAPWGDLIFSSPNFYGMTTAGGSVGGGVQFSYRKSWSAAPITRLLLLRE